MQINDLTDNEGRGWQPLLTQLHDVLLVLDSDYVCVDLEEKFGRTDVHLQSVPAPPQAG